jgi:HAD superfamily hydrolase (TIGR01509 family)
MKINNLNDININSHKAIIFDCFGTLLKINNPKYPYLKLLRSIPGLKKEDYQQVLKNRLFLKDLNDFYNADLSLDLIEKAKKDLELELASIEPYPETIEFLKKLKYRGINFLVCSNLALSYGKKVKQLPIPKENLVLSYDVGTIKPENKIYEICKEKLNLDYSEILFVGDNLIADYNKPKELGMKSLLLKRT